MALKDKLSTLRREHGHTQEQLAGLLGVSRQAISKWELGVSLPETEKLLKISELYNCSLDYLLKDSVTDEYTLPTQTNNDIVFTLKRTVRERKSTRTLWGMPIYHIGTNARGIIAIGFRARGIVAVGLSAVGVISFGLFSLGLLSLGILSLGVLAAGCISLGVLTLGSISFGLISLGALAVGDFSVGALAIGKYFAVGDDARAAIALGKTNAVGDVYQKLGKLTPSEIESVKTALDEIVPSYFYPIKEIIKFFL